MCYVLGLSVRSSPGVIRLFQLYFAHRRLESPVCRWYKLCTRWRSSGFPKVVSLCASCVFCFVLHTNCGLITVTFLKPLHIFSLIYFQHCSHCGWVLVECKRYFKVSQPYQPLLPPLLCLFSCSKLSGVLQIQYALYSLRRGREEIEANFGPHAW